MRKGWLCVVVLVLAVAATAQESYNSTEEQLAGESSETFAPAHTPQQLPVRTLPATVLDSLKNTDAYWYANAEPVKKKQPAPARRSWFQSEAFRNALWMLAVIGFAVLVVWYLATGNLVLFRRRLKTLQEGEAETQTDDIFSIDYNAAINRAVAAEDYRSALRFWYLRTLKTLAEKGLIDYAPGRSDNAYLHNLSGTSHHADFARLSTHFAYAWYGGLRPSAEGYRVLEAEFQDFQNRLR